MSTSSNGTMTASDWQRLAQLRIAFGHQSVGYNLIEGIESVAKDQGTRVAVEESHAPFTQPGIRHFKIGRNGAPHTKIAEFDAIMRGGVAQSADIALMKLCYMDFGPSSDPKQTAQTYIAAIDQLAADYPETTFVPITAPLTTVQSGPKAWVKSMLGKSPAGQQDNVSRAAFNQIVRKHYTSDPRLFDLAAIESRSGRAAFDHAGQRVEALDPALTDDGGHLNAQGRRIAGDALAHHLATIARK